MDPVNLAMFLVAAVIIAITPGPGILYVAARSLSGGRIVGLASSLGTGIGGFAHVIAGAVGVSALVLASAELFTVLKLIGAAYLVFLGWRAFREADAPIDADASPATDRLQALREGVVVEALNPKTAAFFLAFIPQFVDPAAGDVAWQFVLLGTISVVLNTGVDVVVVMLAMSIRRRLAAYAGVVRSIRRMSAAMLCLLGLTLALARRP